jgi:hypothetical protein
MPSIQCKFMTIGTKNYARIEYLNTKTRHILNVDGISAVL